MRALLLSARFHPARVVGAVRWDVLSAQLADRGVDVGVVCRRYPTDGAERDARVVLELGRAGGAPSDPAPDGPRTGSAGGPAATLNRLAVPDTAALRWLADERRVLTAAREFAPDVVVSTSPPHGIHLVAARVARRLGVPLVVELRDPYVGDRRYDVPDREPWRRANRAMERRIVEAASAIVVLGLRHRDDLVHRYPALAARIHVVPNGFHPTPEATDADPAPDVGIDLVVVAAAGRAEMEVLATAARDAWPDRPVRLHTVGFPAAEVEALRPIVEVVDHPWVSTGELAAHLRRADVLLLALERANGAGSGTSTKLYQYLASGRPVLAVNPTVPDRDLLARWSRSVVLDDPSVADATAALRDLVEDEGCPVPDLGAFEAEFAWPALADRMAAILSGLVLPD